jgi:hypothetical protein
MGFARSVGGRVGGHCRHGQIPITKPATDRCNAGATGRCVRAGVASCDLRLWRLLLWIGQGFWQQHEATPTVAAPKVFRLPPEFWTIRTMALLGAVLFAAYGVFGLQADWALGGDHASRAVGSLVAYAAIGAIFAGVIALFLPKA